jgi:tyrosyl-tRNA synthetase
VWLDGRLTSPYDYSQYWINTDDRDVTRFLKMFTLLPLEEVERLSRLEGAQLRTAKEILAFEVTKLCHGEAEATAAREGARAAFGGEGDVESMPTTLVETARLEAGLRAAELFVEVGLCKSRGEATKAFQGGAGWVGERQLRNHADIIGLADFEGAQAILRLGKKRRHRVVVGVPGDEGHRKMP